MNESGIRMLAAIMFTDMVGYTALMHEDEANAKEIRDRHRKVLDDIVIAHQGKILQFYGDGTLSIFGSAIEAVNCAVEIQSELSKSPMIPLRIGIHSGDIVYENEGIYGDGVNIASRIENLSVKGGVLISEKVYDEILNHPELKAIYLGEHELKNVKRPVKIYGVITNNLPVPTMHQLHAKTGAKLKSIAVLPFVNMSADAENEYFSDGITEEILNALTRVDGLHVTSRTSSFAFKGKNEDARVIGEKLNVSNLIEGSVRRAGDKVRITAQLINTTDGYHIWSETFDRKLEDIFEVQDEISRKIANKLHEKLAAEDRNIPLIKTYTGNIDAYNLLLKAKYHWNKWDPDNIEKALKCLEKAIDLDDKFVLPYAFLSSCYVYLGAMGYKPSMEAYPLAKELALTSIELDPDLLEGHLALALVKMFFDWDWKGAEESFNKALSLNSNHAGFYHPYSIYLTVLNRMDEAIEAIDKAYSLDPLSLVIMNARGETYYSAGDLKTAKECFKKAIELEPTFRAALNNLAWINMDEGKIDKAISMFKKVQKLIGNPVRGMSLLGYAYAKAGRIDKAEECLKLMKIREETEKDKQLDFDFAFLYYALKDYEKVFYYLERAYKQRHGGMVFIRFRKHWEDIQDDPRYKELIKRIGFPS